MCRNYEETPGTGSVIIYFKKEQLIEFKYT